jgi:hypothetical protein
MNVVSFDCANKSLGVVLMKIDYDKLDEINIAVKNFMLCKNVGIKEIHDFLIFINKELESVITCPIYETVNLIGDESVFDLNMFQRAKFLNNYLTILDKRISTITNDFEVLIEYQMNSNDKSREISHFLAYHYNYVDKIHSVDANLKNKIKLNDDELLHISHFISKYSNAEYARKQHATALAKYFCQMFNIQQAIISEDVRNKKKDDSADALLQILAYCIKSNSEVVENKIKKDKKIKKELTEKQKEIKKIKLKNKKEEDEEIKKLIL